MKIKTKLTLGIGLLFLLIIFLGLVGIGYVRTLKLDTENILTDNYKTLQYSLNMLEALEKNGHKSIQEFELNLAQQENNISEIGEKEATTQLRSNFDSLKAGQVNSAIQASIRQDLFKIINMNMQAIERKSALASETAIDATNWIAFSGTLCFIIAFILVVNLPANIANPIKDLTESIKQISNENYEERVNFEGHDEFAELAKSFNTMAEKLEEYKNSNLAKLMIEKERVEMLINNMKDPVIGLDENLKIIFANSQAVSIIGSTRESLVGKDSKELALHNDLIRSLVQDLVFSKNGNGIAKSKPLKIFSDGKEGYFDKETLHISIQPTGESSKRLIGHVIILNNVTEYRELDSAKTNFIATVSHEFKTPISSIKMSLQLLENQQIGKLNPEQLNLVESIKDDAGRLLKITSELLNITQAESGNIQLSVTSSNLKEILLNALDATKTQADQKEITFDIRFSDNLPQLQLDQEKTSWVLTNLITNAIHYSHEKSIIYLAITQAEEKIEVSVKDTGQGIAPQYKDKIFDRYFRVPGINKEGTGLGLAISKQLIEAQGGQITVDSELGAGSTFKVILNNRKSA